MDYFFDLLNNDNFRFSFFIIALFIAQLVLFFFILNAYKFYNDFISNESLIIDFNKGLNFNRFIEECKILETKSSFAKIILHGYRDLKKYKEKKNIVYLVRSSMEEQFMQEMIIKNKYLNIYSFSSLFMIYLGFIYFLIESINGFYNHQTLHTYIMSNMKYLVLGLSISFISSFFYFLFKSLNESYYNKQKLYSESFINFIQKNLLNE